MTPKEMFLGMADAIDVTKQRGMKWKPSAEGILWAYNRITELETAIREHIVRIGSGHDSRTADLAADIALWSKVE